MRYTKKGKLQYTRKGRRVKKYGKFFRPAGVKRIGTARGGQRGVRSYPVPKFVNPFRNNYELVQLTYFEDITLNPAPRAIGAGGSNVWNFSFNNLYDTNSTGTGHQPMYFDNYSQLYDRYKVSFAKITVTVVNHFVNTATANSSGVVTTQPNYSYKLLLVRDSSASDLPANVEQLIEQNADNIKWRYVSPQMNGSLPKLTMKCAPHKQAQLSYDDDTLNALVTTGPSRNINACILLTSADGVTDPPSVSLAVKIRYYVKFYDRKVTQSEQ